MLLGQGVCGCQIWWKEQQICISHLRFACSGTNLLAQNDGKIIYHI